LAAAATNISSHQLKLVFQQERALGLPQILQILLETLIKQDHAYGEQT